ncbi:glycosyltransferase family 2 protein [bacterium]|nr:glycosyltransferase family 2 protein [bacterium]
MPQVNIVIPTFNRLKALQRAVLSVLNQSFTDWELTIVDDGSTDSTDRWVQDSLEPELKKKLHYIKSENFGVSHARNLGIKRSSSPLTAFLDSDDQWEPSKLSQQILYLKQNPQIKIVHTNEQWIRNNKPVVQKKEHAKSGGFIFNKCTQLCLIGPSTVVIHQDIFEEVGLFDESLTVCEDYDLWLRIAKKYEIGFLKEALTIKHGGHEDQLSFQYKAMDYWRVKALKKHINCPELNKESQDLLLNTLNKKCEILLKGYQKHNNMKNYNEVQRIQLAALAGSE